MIRALLLALCLALPVGADDAKPMPKADAPDAPLTLSAPKSVKPGGLIEVTATGAGEITWDVEGQFDDGSTLDRSQWRELNARTLVIGIPAEAGVIRVIATIVPPGAKKASPMVKADILVEKTPRITPKVEEKTAKPVTLHVFLIVDRTTGNAASILADNPTLTDALKALGVKVHVLAASSAVIAEQGLEQDLKEAGGVPALLTVAESEDGAPTWTRIRLPGTAEEILAAVKKDIARTKGK